MRFNSILVRLKVAVPVATTLEIVRFQFHTGSIKSEDIPKFSLADIEFQFHTGSIKRLYDSHEKLYHIPNKKVKENVYT